LWLISIGFVWRFFEDRLARTTCCSFNPGVNLASLRTVKLSPSLMTWLFHYTCTTRISGGVGFQVLILSLILILFSFPPLLPSSSSSYKARVEQKGAPTF